MEGLKRMSRSYVRIHRHRAEKSNLFRVHGNLTIRGKTQQAVIPVTVPHLSDGMYRASGQYKFKQTLPKYLSSDHDPLYRFHQWQANLRVLMVQEIKTVPYVPLSHPFVERLIGTIRQ